MTPEAVLEQYEARINLHRFDRLMPLISSEAVFWFNDGSYAGLDEIQRAFERTWSSLGDETYWLDQQRWIAAGDLAAACTYHFHWKTMIDGKAVSGGGRGTTVLRNEAGEWKIVHEHLSQFPRPPA